MKYLFYTLLFVLILVSACTKKPTYKQVNVIPEYAEIQSKEDIFSFTDTCIIPYVYTKVISLKKLSVKEKKLKFVEMLLPSILFIQHDLNEKIKRLEHIESWISKNQEFIKSDSIFLFDLYEQYNCLAIEELKIRLKPHAPSIVLGQAAIESGWGSSRFFQEGNNVFGIWSYNVGENRIKALVGRDSTSIYVRKYPSIEASIRDYYQTIAKVNAYKEFRNKRSKITDPYKLVPLLFRYSEVGDVYTDYLYKIIKNNDLTKYDKYTISEEYLKEERIDLSR